MVVGQIIPVVNPELALAAGALGAIPVLVHLINRRRYHEVKWAAMSFLLAARRQSRRRVQFQHLLLMAVRIAAIVLLGLAVARPYTPASAAVPMRFARTHHVFLLDNSLSMSAMAQPGLTRFELAKKWALDRLAAIPRTDSVSVVSLAEPAEALIGHEAYDRRIVRDRLATIEQTQRATDSTGAIEHAMRILRSSTVAAGNRALYLISDFPYGNWKDQNANVEAPAVPAIRRLVDEAVIPADRVNLVRSSPEEVSNLAVTRLESASPLMTRQMPAPFDVEVRNFGSATVRNAVLQITRDGEIVRREPLPPLEPGGSALSTISIAFNEAGTHLIEAHVNQKTPDLLSVDDSRHLSVDVRERVAVLLVDGRPGANSLSGEAGFLATALSPAPAKHAPPDEWGPSGPMVPTPVGVKVITVPELDGEPIGDFDVVGLCNVQRLTPEQWQRLETYVARGGGLMVFAGDMINVANYNRFGFRDGEGLLPGEFNRGVQEPDGFARFATSHLTHPIVAEFANHPQSGLFLTRVTRYLPIDPAPRRAAVVLRYASDEPAMVASQYGEGRILYYSTTANMDWNNLPAKGDYVSLMFNAVSFLARQHGRHRTVRVGEELTEPLTAVEQSMTLRVSSQDGTTATPRIVPLAEGLQLSFGPIERAGSYRIEIGAEHRWFAVNTSSAESDLRGLDIRTLRQLIDRPVNVLDAAIETALSPPATRTYELASIALLVASVLLITEMWMAMRFGSPRPRPTLVGR